MTTVGCFEERVPQEFAKGGIPGIAHRHAGQEAFAVGSRRTMPWGSMPWGSMPRGAKLTRLLPPQGNAG
jgi:hypothetical protein